jgi:hypothetical protein
LGKLLDKFYADDWKDYNKVSPSNWRKAIGEKLEENFIKRFNGN